MGCLETKTPQKTVSKFEKAKVKNQLAKAKHVHQRRRNRDEKAPDQNRRAKTILPSRGHQEEVVREVERKGKVKESNRERGGEKKGWRRGAGNGWAVGCGGKQVEKEREEASG